MVKQIKYVIFVLICMCVTPLITHAECDYQRQAELSRLASNVQLSYVYNKGTGFQVIMTNLTNDLYAVDMYGQIINGGAERTFSYASGTVSFDIYATDKSCSDNKLLTKTIDLPILNAYSNSDECKSYPGFRYCQVWGSFSITQEQFTQELEEYKKEVNDSFTIADDGDLNVLKIILDTLSKNVFMFVFLGSLIIVVIIYLQVKKRHK